MVDAQAVPAHRPRNLDVEIAGRVAEDEPADVLQDQRKSQRRDQQHDRTASRNRSNTSTSHSIDTAADDHRGNATATSSGTPPTWLTTQAA